MADNSEINLPLTEDGTGYERGAVEAYLGQNSAGHSADMLADASRVGGKYVADAKAEAERILEDAYRKESEVDAKVAEGLSGVKAQAEKILAEAEKTAQEKVSGANRTAGDIIEEALGKVQSLVKSAQDKLKSANEHSVNLNNRAEAQYSDAVSKAGQLVLESEDYVQGIITETQKEAEKVSFGANEFARITREDATLNAAEMLAAAEKKVEENRIEANHLLVGAKTDAKKIAAEAQTTLHNARAEADYLIRDAELNASKLTAQAKDTAESIVFDAETRATNLLAQAQEEYDAKTAAINADVEAGRNALLQFQEYYDDTLGRLQAFYSGKLDDVATLSKIRLPDGRGAQYGPEAVETERDVTIPIAEAPAEGTETVPVHEESNIVLESDDDSVIAIADDVETEDSSIVLAPTPSKSAQYEVIDLDSIDDSFFDNDNDDDSLELVDDKEAK